MSSVPFMVDIKLWFSFIFNKMGESDSSGMYYKSLTIVIYECNDCVIVKYDRNDSGQYY
jgi:hypothetical protein